MVENLREHEAAMLGRCTAAAAAEGEVSAADGREANVFRVAAMVLQSRHPLQARSLRNVAERYFASHPLEVMSVAAVVQETHVVSLPRLRDMLTHRLVRGG